MTHCCGSAQSYKEERRRANCNTFFIHDSSKSPSSTESREQSDENESQSSFCAADDDDDKNISVLFAPQLICYYSRAGTVESLPSSSQQFEAFRSLTRQSLRAFLTFRLKKSLLPSDSRGDGGRRQEAKKNSSKTIRLFNESKSQSNDERGNVKKSSKVTLLIIIKRSESFDFFSGVFLARLRSREF